MKKIAVIVSIAVVLALAGVTTWLFVSGKLVWVDSNTRPATAKIVCDKATVDTYNSAMFFIIRGSDTTASIDSKGVDDLKTEIQAKEGYREDPTCQTILYLTAVYKSDYEAAKAAAASVKELHDKNIFADNNIRGNEALFMYEASVFALSPEGKAQEGMGDQ